MSITLYIQNSTERNNPRHTKNLSNLLSLFLATSTINHIHPNPADTQTIVCIVFINILYIY